ncbi:DinB family protein [Kribbella sp. NPDC051936]|uniref:DinB family protein n=1 Tax=Kribbella sp. NPDC051936 TaxID=3154946 RepID=UPI00343E71F6
MDRLSVHEELERARADFRRLVESSDDDLLRKPSNGTRWSNRELLFHMLLGYLIIRALPGLVRVFGRLPRGASRGYARLLNAVTRSFDEINYLGSYAGGRTLSPARMVALFDRVVDKLHRRLDTETDADLERGMVPTHHVLSRHQQLDDTPAPLTERRCGYPGGSSVRSFSMRARISSRT